MFSDVVDQVGQLSDDALDARLREIEGSQRELAAVQSAALAECERRRTHRPEHATIYGRLRASLGWSEADCRSGTQLARLIEAHPDVGDALFDHRMPVAAAVELARAFARTGERLAEVIGAFTRLAERVEHDELSNQVRGWVSRTLADDAHEQTRTADERRNAHWRADGDGGGLAVEWGPLDAIAAREILDHYLEAEWLADWEATVERYGDDASKLLMPRTDAQRRADAVLAALHDAAARPPGSKRPEPVVNVHVDHRTFEDLLIEAEVLPERTVDPFDDPTPYVTERMCRTDHGDPIDPKSTLQLLLAGHIRFVVRNDQGVPIRWGRTKRLFEGAARDAVRSMSTRCTHPGCRVPTRRTQTDHVEPWVDGGLTDPDNGGVLCRRHNLLKAHGYRVHRDHLGTWHTYRPDGTEVR